VKNGESYYQILGIPSTATAADIKKAFRELALKYHPDHADDTATQKMQDINEAYAALSEESSRAAYNAQYGFGPRREPEKQKSNDHETPANIKVGAKFAALNGTGAKKRKFYTDGDVKIILDGDGRITINGVEI
jgi:DnaJ-class molecular chaperone